MFGWVYYNSNRVVYRHIHTATICHVGLFLLDMVDFDLKVIFCFFFAFFGFFIAAFV